MYKLHVAVGEYEFVEKECETLESLRESYIEVKSAFKDGLDPKEWRELLDGYLAEGKIVAGKYEQLSDIQMYVIQELKKAFKRVK